MAPDRAVPAARAAAVVTGAGRGQGASHAATLLAQGFEVHAIDLAFTSECPDHESVHRHTMDVTDEDAWHQLATDLHPRSSPVRVLVNNAGIVHVAALEDETREGFDRVLSVNLTGAFLATRALWPLLEQAEGASVINVTSIFGVNGAAGYLSYASSKAALIGFTKTLALEGADRGIRVNAVAPGTVLTAMREAEPDSGSALHSTPMARGASPKEISHVVRFLASNEASFLTGAVIPVDGGYSAR